LNCQFIGIFYAGVLFPAKLPNKFYLKFAFLLKIGIMKSIDMVGFGLPSQGQSMFGAIK